ncbi:FAD/NAD(P)-binding domain-containing protein [Thozetella sp. PMI_491]|nr:FAD/NAD(P)-binding domain-containing protein [Thozetella sp. PMI_491]
MGGGHRIKSVAIIGAGASGAAAATAFAAEKYFDIIKVFERRHEAGGTWCICRIYDPVPRNFDLTPGGLPPAIDKPLEIPRGLPTTTPHSVQERFDLTPVYDGLTTNVPGIVMALSDRRYPYGPFVPHWIPRQYLSEYFSWHGVDKNLVLNTTVEDVSQILPAADSRDRWRLTLRKHSPVANLDEWWQEDFDAVIIANGHYSVPFVPEVQGLPEYIAKFPGRVTHSKVYRSPHALRGKRVLVVGNSASGHDVSEQLLASDLIPKPIYLSRRSSKPFDGDEPPKGIVWKPVISQYTADGTIVFEDGTRLAHYEIDAIIYSTGYKPSYPFWNAAANGRPLFSYEDERLVGNYQHAFFPDYPTLGVVGFPRALSFRSFEYQSIALARVFSGRAALPSVTEQRSWEAKRAAEARAKNEGFHKLTWDTGEILDYLEHLYRLAGLPTLAGKGRLPPTLDDDIRWAIEHIKKYPVKDPKNKHEVEGTGEWAVIEKMKKDSLWFI